MIHENYHTYGGNLRNVGNTAISKLMEFVNLATQSKTLPKNMVKDFLRLLAPFAPHLAEELWCRLKETNLIAHDSWPEYDESLCAEEYVNIPVQINGKVRSLLKVDLKTSQQKLEELALADKKIKGLVYGKEIVKIIVVPNRIVNIVVR